MIGSNAPWQLITTFSEWGEGTSVEDATDWDSLVWLRCVPGRPP